LNDHADLAYELKRKIIYDYEINIKKPITQHKAREMAKWETRNDFDKILAMTSFQKNSYVPGEEIKCITPSGNILEGLTMS
jgi:hypothetical protein